MVPLVVVDDYMGAFTAVTHLIDTGCKKIAFYGSPMNMEISKNRYNGYHDAIVKHGLTENPDWVRICDNRAQAEAITPETLDRVSLRLLLLVHHIAHSITIAVNNLLFFIVIIYFF